MQKSKDDVTLRLMSGVLHSSDIYAQYTIKGHAIGKCESSTTEMMALRLGFEDFLR